MDKASGNIVLRDWLTFTTQKHTPQEVIAHLGMSGCAWTEISGWYGYKTRLYFGGISVLYDGQEGMGVCCEMAGSGCRSFEDYSTLEGKWDDLLAWIRGESLHITRFDVAYDDHTGILDIDRIAEDTEEQRYVSRLNAWNVTKSNHGTSVQIGSSKSRTLVRIYDKAAERGYTDGRHWVRVEMQLRDDRASGFLDLDLPIGESFAGVLLNYLRFVEPDETDSNRSRWAMAEYWAELIGGVGRISIYTAPGGEYNLEQCKHYVSVQAGNAIACMLDIFDSPEDFATWISYRPCKPNKKYDIIVREHHARQEAYAAKLKKWFDLGLIDDPDRDLEEVCQN